MLKRIVITIIIFFLSGCPFRLPVCWWTNSLEILNLSDVPLYYQSDTSGKRHLIRYNRTFSLPYEVYLPSQSSSCFEIGEPQLNIDSATYTFYTDKTTKTPIFSYTAEKIKELFDNRPRTFVADTYKAVLFNNKIQYLHKDDIKKMQPQQWKKDTDYPNHFVYKNLVLTVQIKDHSPFTEFADYEVILDFYITDWLFFIKHSEFPYYFNTSEVFIISHGEEIYLEPDNVRNDLQKIFPDKSTFRQHARFTYYLPHSPIDSNTIYIGGISIDGQKTDVLDFSF